MSVYQVREAGMPPAIGISDGFNDIVVLKCDIKYLVELLQIAEIQR